MFNLKICVAVVIVTISSIVTLPAYSQTTTDLCSSVDTIIYYGNGVLSDRVGAKIALAELENNVRTTLPVAELEKIDFALAYNTTYGALADLYEAFIQDISSDAALFWRTLAILVPMPASFRDNLTAFASRIEDNAFLNSQDLSNQVASYKNSIFEGKKVIVVSHSQGNFFANAAYNRLSTSERMSFGIVAVANPASSVATGGPHTTLVEDLVILAIRLAKQRLSLPTPQLPNVTDLPTISELSGHFFVESYLALGSNSRSKILNDLVSVRTGLQQPAGSAGTPERTLVPGVPVALDDIFPIAKATTDAAGRTISAWELGLYPGCFNGAPAPTPLIITGDSLFSQCDIGGTSGYNFIKGTDVYWASPFGAGGGINYSGWGGGTISVSKDYKLSTASIYTVLQAQILTGGDCGGFPCFIRVNGIDSVITFKVCPSR